MTMEEIASIIHQHTAPGYLRYGSPSAEARAAAGEILFRLKSKLERPRAVEFAAPAPACDCGAARVTLAKHYSWCSLNQPSYPRR